MFMGPVEQDKTWNDNALHGVKKFLDRIERLPTLERPQETTVALDSVMHTAIKGLTHDMKKLKFNTAVSKLMIFVNALYEAKTMHASYLEVLTLLIAPFATQLAERLWA